MAVKLKDGFFLGDESAERDFDFLLANKIARIINCGGDGGLCYPHGIKCLAFNWVDNDSQIILDVRDQVIREIAAFIDETDGVLICSQKGLSRSVTIVVAYLMFKYHWSLNKSLEFVQSRKELIAIKPGFHRQLVAFERRLLRDGVALSRDWQDGQFYYVEDHLVVHNTFLNSQPRRKIPEIRPTTASQSSNRVAWRDMTRNLSLEIGAGAYTTENRASILKKIPTPIMSTSRYIPRSASPSMRRPSFNGEEQERAVFPRTPQVKYYARPPSPMVRTRTVITPTTQPSRTPSPSRNIRTPSPSRVAFNTSAGTGYSDSAFGLRISVDKPRSLIASQLRRTQTPMITSLDRPQSTPLWRLR